MAIRGDAAGSSQRRTRTSVACARLTQPLVGPPVCACRKIPDPRPGTIHGYVMSGLPNGYTDVHLTPEAGLLVLFPHWLEHFVEPHDNDEPRVMVAASARMTNLAPAVSRPQLLWAADTIAVKH